MNQQIKSFRQSKNDEILMSARLQTIRTMIELENQQNAQEYYRKTDTTTIERSSRLILKNILHRMRRDVLVKQFVERIKRNNFKSQPPTFTKFDELVSERKSQERRVSGLKIPLYIKLVSYILYSIGIIIIYALSTFQGFIRDFWENKTGQPSVITLKIISTICILVLLVIKTVEVQNDRGIQIKSLYTITKNNFSSFSYWCLLLNFIVSILFNMFYTQAIGILVFLVTFINIPIINKIIQTFQAVYAGTFYEKQISKLAILVVFNIAFCHLVTVILLAISFIDTNGNGWVNSYELANIPWYQLYFWTYYWAATIIMTVGFGDFSAKIWQQAIFVAIIEILAVMVLAYVIGEVGSILLNIRSFNAEIDNDAALFFRMCHHNKISPELKHQIQSYLRQSAVIKKMFEFEQQKKLLDKLPQRLRKNYIAETNKTIFMNLPFFMYLNSVTLIALSGFIEGKIFYPGENLLTNKAVKLDFIAILKEGQMGLAYKRKNSRRNGFILHTLSVHSSQEKPILLNNQLFDEHKQIKFDIIAQQYSFCYILSTQDFIAGLKAFKLDYQYYFCLLHHHQITEAPSGFKIQCQYCPGRHHTYFQCPKLHYIPIKDIIKLRSFIRKTQSQQRKPIYIRPNKKTNLNASLKLWNSIYKKCAKLWSLIESQELINMSDRSISDSKMSINEILPKIQFFPQKNQKQLKQQQKLQSAIYKVTLLVLKHQNVLDNSQNDSNFQSDILNDYLGYCPLANPQRLIQFSISNKKKNKAQIVRFMK